MAVVYVGAVKFDDPTQLLHNSSAGCFDAQHVENLNAAVRIRTCKVDAIDAHDCLEIDTVRLQHPLLLCLDGACLVGKYFVMLLQKDFLDARNPAQAHRIQHSVFKLAQEDVFFYSS